MISQAVVNYGAPLQEMRNDIPTPTGDEVLIKVSHCGVCHSDVHIHDGFFDLGEQNKLDLSTSHTLPLTLGHEISGSVAALGPEAAATSNLRVGDLRAVYPWIGCGSCAACTGDEEHLCAKPRNLGVNVNGGYSNYVLVPHSRYLLDHDPVPANLAALTMCSGLTAYSALKKFPTLPRGASLVIVGLGGVGLMGVQFARALHPDAKIIAIDIDDAKLALAKNSGAHEVFNGNDPATGKALYKATSGGAMAAVDFVGAESSFSLANRALRKGGTLVVVGLFGGQAKLPIALFPLRAIAIIGSYVGSLSDAKTMLDLVKAGKIDPIPFQEQPLSKAESALAGLRSGAVLGRTVLRCGER